jgi:cbb3-type cytochrome oxidase maturation protein
MTVLIYLVPIALALGLTGLAAFLWSLRSGQYEDMEGAALRMLSDDDIVSRDETHEQAAEGRTFIRR